MVKGVSKGIDIHEVSRDHNRGKSYEGEKDRRRKGAKGGRGKRRH